ncbi:unnamed protein product [Protopolystoma xenopodis]|uniref:Uncharacterized protein n=1 Tax=Protopolystoma xenopodis TaxID=117903 RepID=A0A448WPS5_9PLAT|nr:unnamed protein product [Protopolystoma xenopodis]
MQVSKSEEKCFELRAKKAIDGKGIYDHTLLGQKNVVRMDSPSAHGGLKLALDTQVHLALMTKDGLHMAPSYANFPAFFAYNSMDGDVSLDSVNTCIAFSIYFSVARSLTFSQS